MRYTLNLGNKRLTNFHENALPIGRNWKFSSSPIITFSKQSFVWFDSKEEAERYKAYMLQQIAENGNSNRYESAITGSTAKLLSIANRLCITEY